MQFCVDSLLSKHVQTIYYMLRTFLETGKINCIKLVNLLRIGELVLDKEKQFNNL